MRAHKNRTAATVLFSGIPLFFDLGQVVLESFFFFALFFHVDFPVKNLGKQAAQQNDGSQRAQLIPGFNDDGVQNLAADFEFQTQHDALGEVDAGAGIFADVAPESARHADADDRDADDFDEHDADLYKVFEVQMKSFHNCGVLLCNCDIIAAGGCDLLLQLYLHFPFCKRKCFYCDFCSAQETPETVAAYCNALQTEIRLMAGKYRDAKISTVFLGGGTPSFVPAAQLKAVLQTLRESFELMPDAEFTSEANPGTLTGEWLDVTVGCGLNRLSLGVQAAQDHLLAQIGRIHTAEDAAAAVRLARSHGLANLNLDAMFGLPAQTEKDYLDTLRFFKQLDAQHISAYSLILEEGTALEKMVASGRVQLPDEDETAAMYEHGIEWLGNEGYRRYEVSNFAKEGFECRHNLGYWQGEWYLGLGVAAHSMLPPEKTDAFCLRKGNACDVKAYIRAMQQGEAAPLESLEDISLQDAMFEAVMLGLRTTDGVDERLFEKRYGVSLRGRYGEKLEAIVRDGLGGWQNGRFALTPRGIEIQNDVLVRLMD